VLGVFGWGLGVYGGWVYTTTAINATLSGSKVLVTATDRPNNVVTKEITL